MREFIAKENDNGMRLSRFVLKNTANLPHSLLHKSFRNKRIKVNGKRGQPDTRLQTGDSVAMYLNDEFFPPRENQKLFTFTPLAIQSWAYIYEDTRIAVLNKPAGILSHSDEKGTPNLLDSFICDLIEKGEYDPKENNGFAPALCNRLDRGTEGLLIAAKRYDALRDMNQLIKEGNVAKHYHCLVWGTPPSGIHKAYLQRDTNAKKVTVDSRPFARAKEIITGIDVLETHGGVSLCKIDLRTGRTHQIRAHLGYLGTPLLGDRKYGPDTPANLYLPGCFALAATHLALAGNLPEQNTLSDLGGRAFHAPHTQLESFWNQYKKNGPTSTRLGE